MQREMAVSEEGTLQNSGLLVIHKIHMGLTNAGKLMFLWDSGIILAFIFRILLLIGLGGCDCATYI